MNNVERFAKDLVRRFKKYAWRIEIAGSIRRRVNNPGDIDILIIPRSKYTYRKIGEALGAMNAAIINLGPRRTSALFRKIEQVQVDVVFTNKKSWGASLMYLTGPAGANIWNRQLARSKGYILNQYGLFHRKTKKRVPAYAERSIYRALGKSYREPWQRGQPR